LRLITLDGTDRRSPGRAPRLRRTINLADRAADSQHRHQLTAVLIVRDQPAPIRGISAPHDQPS
jgi:hypothetical protein